MVELLVTLVLLGLIASVAAPGMDAWLRSRQASAIRTSLASDLALLPLQAKGQGAALYITDASQLPSKNLALEFITPVTVLANGYCQGGEVALLQGSEKNPQRVVYEVIPPFCEVSRRANR